MWANVVELKISRCTVLSEWQTSPMRGDFIATLGGRLFLTQGTVQSDDCSLTHADGELGCCMQWMADDS